VGSLFCESKQQLGVINCEVLKVGLRNCQVCGLKGKDGENEEMNEGRNDRESASFC